MCVLIVNTSLIIIKWSFYYHLYPSCKFRIYSVFLPSELIDISCSIWPYRWIKLLTRRITSITIVVNIIIVVSNKSWVLLNTLGTKETIEVRFVAYNRWIPDGDLHHILFIRDTTTALSSNNNRRRRWVLYFHCAQLVKWVLS